MALAHRQVASDAATMLLCRRPFHCSWLLSAPTARDAVHYRLLESYYCPRRRRRPERIACNVAEIVNCRDPRLQRQSQNASDHLRGQGQLLLINSITAEISLSCHLDIRLRLRRSF